MDFTIAVHSTIELAETPIWDERKQCLYWTDLFGGRVHRYTPDTKSDEFWETNSLIGSAVPTDDPDRVLCALATGMHLLNTKDGTLTFVTDPKGGDPNFRYNDTRVDAKGRIFTSTMSTKYGTPEYDPDVMTGNFYRVDPDGSVHIVQAGIQQFNCMLWSPDNTVLYVVDTYHKKLLTASYDLESGEAGPLTVALDCAELGMPDGMAVDCEGNLYLCHWAGHITVWSPDFRLIDDIPFPVEYATCCGFGGADMKTLFVTSSHRRYTPEKIRQYPDAGSTYQLRREIPGCADHFFKIWK